jgi:hypothetical protein
MDVFQHKKQYQRTESDCLLCCVSTITGIPYEECKYDFYGNDWVGNLDKFLNKHGLEAVWTKYELKDIKHNLSGFQIIAIANPIIMKLYSQKELKNKSRLGIPIIGALHAVVSYNGEIYHDPAKSFNKLSLKYFPILYAIKIQKNSFPRNVLKEYPISWHKINFSLKRKIKIYKIAELKLRKSTSVENFLSFQQRCQKRIKDAFE